MPFTPSLWFVLNYCQALTLQGLFLLIFNNKQVGVSSVKDLQCIMKKYNSLPNIILIYSQMLLKQPIKPQMKSSDRELPLSSDRCI